MTSSDVQDTSRAVRIRSQHTQRAAAQVGRASYDVYLVSGAAPLRFDLSGPGKLILTAHPVVSEGNSPVKTTVYVGVDLHAVRSITLPTRMLSKATLDDLPGYSLGAGKDLIEALDAGAHTIDVTAPDAAAGVVVRLQFFAQGSREPSPVIFDRGDEEALAGASARELDDLIDGLTPVLPGEERNERARTANEDETAIENPAAPASGAAPIATASSERPPEPVPKLSATPPSDSQVSSPSDFLALGVRLGGRAPLVGGDVGLAVWGDAAFVWPLLASQLQTGLELGFLRQSMGATTRIQSTDINTAVVVNAVPILARLAWHQPLIARLGIWGAMSAGPLFVSLERDQLGASVSASHWLFALRPAAGVEVKLGPGWLGAELAYLWAPHRDYGQLVLGYSPAAFEVCAQYRLRM